MVKSRGGWGGGRGHVRVVVGVGGSVDVGVSGREGVWMWV